MGQESNNKFVPIIILNWNGIEDTIECITTLDQLDYPDYKIYLLDNGSDQENIDQLNATYIDHPKVDLIFSESNLGFTLGNNFVMKKLLDDASLDFDYIALLNNDTAVDSQWLTELVSCAKNNQASMISSKMINYYNRSIMDNAGHRMINTAEIVPIGHAESVELHTEQNVNFGSCAGATLYSKVMLQDIGLFDEHFVTGYEDAEIGVRATVLGYKCMYAPKAIVYHKISQSVSKIFNYDYLLHIQKNIFYAFFKLMPLPVVLISIPSFLIKYLIVFIIDIIFWRPLYLKIHYHTLRDLLTTEYNVIKKSRKHFFSNHKPISTFQILKKQEFFLWFDTKRFVNFILLKKQSEFDKIHTPND